MLIIVTTRNESTQIDNIPEQPLTNTHFNEPINTIPIAHLTIRVAR